MIEPKKRGRPKKVVAVTFDKDLNVVKPENPDCAPATKGYVKCIARRIYKDIPIVMEVIHTGGSLSFACGFVGGLIWMILHAIHYESYVVWTVGIASLVLMIVGVDIDSMNITVKQDKGLWGCRENENPKCIEKYTPPQPICEKKEECE